MGRSYELASLIESYDAKAVVLTSATVSLDAQTRVANACRHHGIGLYHMHVQLDRVIEAKEACVRTDAAAVTVASKGTPNAAATFAHAPLSILISESEPCVRCGGRNVHRSRTKGVYERVRKWHTPARPFRCNDCGWRGWLFPLERGIAFDEAGESDLRSLDAAFTTLATVGESAGGSERR
jgi:hypothetical protein